MAILSEGKGVSIWMSQYGVNNKLGNYILKIYKDLFNVSFHRISYEPLDNKPFITFTHWFLKQDLQQLKKDFFEYEESKIVNKELHLENLLKGPIATFIRENPTLTRNQMNKKLKGTKKYNFHDFKKVYKVLCEQ